MMKSEFKVIKMKMIMKKIQKIIIIEIKCKSIKIYLLINLLLIEQLH